MEFQNGETYEQRIYVIKCAVALLCVWTRPVGKSAECFNVEHEQIPNQVGHRVLQCI